MKHCVNCDLFFEDNAKWCTNCGTPLQEADTEPTPVAAQPLQQPDSADIRPPEQSPQETAYIPYTPPVAAENPPPIYDAQPAHTAPVQEQPSGGSTTLWLVLSIICTALACTPFGIPSLLAAIAAKKAENRGDIALRNAKVRSARIWFIVSTILGVVFYVLYFVLYAVVITGLIHEYL